MARTDGGPAFPRPASEYTVGGTLDDGNQAIPDQDGMTLRDYFAGQALSGMVQYWGTTASPDLAKRAYALADAMLKARDE